MRALLFSIVSIAFAAALPCQTRLGDPVAPPRGLTVVCLDVGQGDATILVGPTGKSLVFDAGPQGQGTTVVAELKRLGVKSVDYVVASHYHPDHIGGLDDVMRAVPFGGAFDRGVRDAPNNTYYRNYTSAAGNKRHTVKLGQVLDLGGGAKATVLAYDGNVLGRGSLPIRNTYQQENAASVVLKVEYGDFDMWLGGDLTGGGSKTYDVESPASAVCGNVDVYQMDHHGSATSSNATLISNLRPELCIGSNGTRNPFGHPHTSVINRLNSRYESRVLLNTTQGARWSGYTETGTTRLVTDGWRYRVTAASGQNAEFYVDEAAPPAPRVGSVVISEVQREPSTSLGEYVEIVNRGGAPLGLRGLRVAGNAGEFTIEAPYRLLPGGRLLVFTNGLPSRNGGLGLGHCWPFGTFSIGDTADRLSLRLGLADIDRLDVGSRFAGGRGVAAERVDMLATTTASNFRASTKRYGSDFGTPGRPNSVGSTRWRLDSGLEVLDPSAVGGPALHLYATGLSNPRALDVMGLAFGSFPGVVVGSIRIPLNPDPLLNLTVGLPGFISVLPATGVKAIRLEVPAATGIRGKSAVLAHFLLDPFGPSPVPSASPATSFIFP